jgi:hypothetical protein
MNGYHPRGVSFNKIEEACNIGNKYYALRYWTNLVVDGSGCRTVEFLNKNSAIAAYHKIKSEGTNREHSLKEFEFKGNTWTEHAKNSMFDDGVHIIEAYQ